MQLPIPYRSGQKRPWGSIPRINRGHPLAVGLVFYAYDAGGQVIDLINSGHGAIIASTTRLTTSTSVFGNGLKYPGTSTSDSITLPLGNQATQKFTNTAPYSVASGFFGTLGTPNYFTSTGTASVDVAGFNVITGPNLSFFCNNGGTQLNYAASLTANVYHTGVFVATSGTAGLMYFDGKLDTSVSAITTTNATTGQQVNLNSSTANAQNFGGGLNGYIYYWAGWNRILTAGEASLLHADPYCFLIYPEDEIFATLVGTTVVAAVTLGGTAEFYAPNLGPEFRFKPNLAFPPSITVPIFATSAFFDVVKLKQSIITIPDIVPRFPPPKLAGDTQFESIRLKQPVVETSPILRAATLSTVVEQPFFETIRLKQPTIDNAPILFNPLPAAAFFVVEQPFFEPLWLKRSTEFTQGPFTGTSPPLSGTFATSSFFDPNSLLKISERLSESFGVPFLPSNIKTTAFFESIKLKQPIIDQLPVFPPIVTVALAIVEQPFFESIWLKRPSEFTQGPFSGTSPTLTNAYITQVFFDMIRPKPPIIDKPTDMAPLVISFNLSVTNWFDAGRLLKPPKRFGELYPQRFWTPESYEAWFDKVKLLKIPERTQEAFGAPFLVPIIETTSFFDIVKIKQPPISFEFLQATAQSITIKNALVDWFAKISLKRSNEFAQGPFAGSSPSLASFYATQNFFDQIKLLKIPDRLQEIFGILIPPIPPIPPIPTRLTAAKVIALDAAFGNVNILRFFQAPATNNVIVGEAIAVLIDAGSELNLTDSYSMIFTKPDGIQFMITSPDTYVGLIDVGTPKGIFESRTYTLCVLPAAFVDQHGFWSCYLQSRQFTSVSQSFYIGPPSMLN